MKHYIVDWAGNILGTSEFNHFEFDSEHDAIEYIEEQMPEDEDDLTVIDARELKALIKRTKLA